MLRELIGPDLLMNRAHIWPLIRNGTFWTGLVWIVEIFVWAQRTGLICNLVHPYRIQIELFKHHVQRKFQN